MITVPVQRPVIGVHVDHRRHRGIHGGIVWRRLGVGVMVVLQGRESAGLEGDGEYLGRPYMTCCRCVVHAARVDVLCGWLNAHWVLDSGV